MSKRYLIVVTESERDTLRGAVRTAQEEDCGRPAFNRLERAQVKIANAIPVTRAAWLNLNHAIGNSLQDEPETILPEPASRKSALDLWAALMGKLWGRV